VVATKKNCYRVSRQRGGVGFPSRKERPLQGKEGGELRNRGVGSGDFESAKEERGSTLATIRRAEGLWEMIGSSAREKREGNPPEEF